MNLRATLQMRDRVALAPSSREQFGSQPLKTSPRDLRHNCVSVPEMSVWRCGAYTDGPSQFGNRKASKPALCQKAESGLYERFPQIAVMVTVSSVALGALVVHRKQLSYTPPRHAQIPARPNGRTAS